MKLNIPVESPQDVAKKLQIVCDDVGMAILGLLYEQRHTYFNDISRELSEEGIASRRTAHARIARLENAGIVESRMEPLESSEADIRRWVRNFYIRDEHKEWIKKLLDLRGRS
ncbi:MAG: hypothetical protein DRQ88_12380 [Epsilonproteobacteria bacterium]|nr:MAG: hypothetical protein DRQ88_12380 [Campylobacterota bacterium]